MRTATETTGPRETATRQLHGSMKRMALQIRTLLSQPLPDLELSWIQFQVLAIVEDKPHRFGYIGVCTGYDDVETRELLERLTMKGLITSYQDLADGEMWELTAAGIELIRDFDEIGRTRIEEAASFLTLEELESIVYWMDRLADGMVQRSLSDALTEIDSLSAPAKQTPVPDQIIERI